MARLFSASPITKLMNKVGLSSDRIKSSSFLTGLLPSFVPWMPIAFTISITTKCNLKCTICSRTIHGIENMHMSKDMFLKAAKYFNNRSITILGAGEPFLHPNIFEFIQICQSKNSSVKLVTNGTLLSEEKSKRLLQYPNIESVTFSIDGVYENYNKIRVNGDFQTVINNLRRISELKKERNATHPLLSVNFVGMRSNTGDFPELIKIAGPYTNTITFSHPIIFSQDETNEHLNKNAEFAKRVFKESMEVAHKCDTELILRSLKPYTGGCIEPWTAPYIGIKGDVYPCCMIGGGDPQKTVVEYYGDASIIRDVAGYSLGNIMDTDLNQIWNSDKLRQFRKALSKVNAVDLKRKYNGDIYVEMMRKWTPSTFYCKLCPYRWNCAC